MALDTGGLLDSAGVALGWLVGWGPGAPGAAEGLGGAVSLAGAVVVVVVGGAPASPSAMARAPSACRAIQQPPANIETLIITAAAITRSGTLLGGGGAGERETSGDVALALHTSGLVVVVAATIPGGGGGRSGCDARANGGPGLFVIPVMPVTSLYAHAPAGTGAAAFGEMRRPAALRARRHTTRKPMTVRCSIGLHRNRYAQRRLLAPLAHAPPRMTRKEEGSPGK